MELTEPIESINLQLIDEYGIDTITGQPICRVIWAADEREMRLSKFTPEGFELIYSKMMLLPKYPQNDLDYKDRYILERLVLVPDHQQAELTTKISYEPLWVFRDKNNDYLPPTFWACKFCVDRVNERMGKKVPPVFDDSETPEVKEQRIKKLEEELFG